jgi:hypothetical protein
MSIIHTTSHALRDTASLIERFNALKAPIAKAISKANARINSVPAVNAAYNDAAKQIVPALYAKSNYVSRWEVEAACDIFYKHSPEAKTRKRLRANLSLSRTVLERFAKQINSVSIDAGYAIEKIDHELERVGNWAYPTLTAEDHSALRAFRADLSALRSDIAVIKTEINNTDRLAFAAGLTSI